MNCLCNTWTFQVLVHITLSFSVLDLLSHIMLHCEHDIINCLLVLVTHLTLVSKVL